MNQNFHEIFFSEADNHNYHTFEEFENLPKYIILIDLKIKEFSCISAKKELKYTAV